MSRSWHNTAARGPHLMYHLLASVVVVVATALEGQLSPPVTSSETEAHAVLDAVARRIEPHAGFVRVVVLSPKLSDETRKMLLRHPKVIEPSQLPPSDTHSLPAAHFLLEAFDITGDHGFVDGVVGAVPLPKPLLLNCGTGFTLRVTKKNDRWDAEVAGLRVC